ncbi:MAG: AAA family ATPase [Candidatus Omnitrophota bacterium]
MALEKKLYILLATRDQNFIGEVNACLKQEGGGESPWEVRACAPVELSQYAGPKQPDVLFLDLESLQGDRVELVGEIVQVFDRADVICSKMHLEVPEMLRFLKVGVKDFLMRASLQKDLQEYLRKFKNTRRHSKEESKEKTPRGKILAVFGPKGGSGVTLFSVNLAASLLQCSGQRTLVCDLSSGCGDAMTYLNLHPLYTIRDVLDHADLIDNSFLEGTLIRHASGLEILAAAREDQEAVSSSNFVELQNVFSYLRTMADYVIVDLGGRDVSLVQMVLSQSDTIFLIGTLDVLSMKGMVSFFNKLRKMHFPFDKVIVVINRFNAKNQLDIVKDFEKHTGHSIAYRLPNHYALCIQALNEGKLLEDVHPGSALGKGIEEIAQAVRAPGKMEQPTAKKNLASSFLKRLGA